MKIRKEIKNLLQFVYRFKILKYHPLYMNGKILKKKKKFRIVLSPTVPFHGLVELFARFFLTK